MRNFLLGAALTLLVAQAPSVLASPQSSTRPASLADGDHDATINGLRLHYVVVGQGPLLVVNSPGWGIASNYLRNSFGPLESHFTVVFVDARGNGGSQRPADRLQMSSSAMADDLEGLRKYWSLPQLRLLGHSNGSAIVLGYAERYPDRVHTLILVDGELVDYDLTALHKRYRDAASGDPRFKTILAHMDDDPKPTTDQAFKAELGNTLGWYLYDPVNGPPAVAKLIDNMPSLWAEQAMNEADAKDPMAQMVDLGKVKAATLILVGRDDRVCPVPLSQWMHQGIAGSQLRIFEHAGHFPWVEQPAAFFDTAIGFLQKN